MVRCYDFIFLFSLFFSSQSLFLSHFHSPFIIDVITVWPAKFTQFAINSKEAWEDSEHVLEVTRQDFDDPQFNSTARILAFIDDREVQDEQEAILSALPNIARRMTDAEILVGVVSCASELEDDPRVVDCSTLGVSWLPDIKLFAANQTLGVSLLGEEFSERRDVQIGKTLYWCALLNQLLLNNFAL